MAAAKSRKSPVEQSLNVDFLGGKKKKKVRGQSTCDYQLFSLPTHEELNSYGYWSIGEKETLESS